MRLNAMREYILETGGEPIIMTKYQLKEYRFIKSESVFNRFGVIYIGAKSNDKSLRRPEVSRHDPHSGPTS